MRLLFGSMSVNACFRQIIVTRKRNCTEIVAPWISKAASSGMSEERSFASKVQQKAGLGRAPPDGAGSQDAISAPMYPELKRASVDALALSNFEEGGT